MFTFVQLDIPPPVQPFLSTKLSVGAFVCVVYAYTCIYMYVYLYIYTF